MAQTEIVETLYDVEDIMRSIMERPHEDTEERKNHDEDIFFCDGFWL